MISSAKNDPASTVESFLAQIVILNTAYTIRSVKAKIHAHCSTYLQTHNCFILCTFTKIISKLDRKTGKVIEQNPEFIRGNETALVEIKLHKSLPE